MEDKYKEIATVLKAISDPKRLKIVNMLSCGELCACNILTAFNITQPTLSHDMKVLSNAKVVRTRREGQNTFYSLDMETLKDLEEVLHDIFQESDDCICHKVDESCDSVQVAI